MARVEAKPSSDLDLIIDLEPAYLRHYAACTIAADGAFAPVVDPLLFARAQELILVRARRFHGWYFFITSIRGSGLTQ